MDFAPACPARLRRPCASWASEDARAKPILTEQGYRVGPGSSTNRCATARSMTRPTAAIGPRSRPHRAHSTGSLVYDDLPAVEEVVKDIGCADGRYLRPDRR